MVSEAGLAAIVPSRVAERAGVGRATLYRHYSGRLDLIKDGLGHARFAPPPSTVDPRADVVAHLLSLAMAFQQGPLRPALAALLTESLHDAEIAALLDEMLEQGQQGLCTRLSEPDAARLLRPGTSIDTVVELLGGWVFYRSFIRRDRLTHADVVGLVAQVLP